MVYSQNFAPSLSDSFDGPRATGRVDLSSTRPVLSIQQADERPTGACSFSAQARSGVHTSTPLNELFFSRENIEALQQGIRYRVWVESQGRFTIGRQNERELMIVMRSVYYQHARHSPSDIVGQVRELNGRVIEWSVPEILNNLLQYEAYKRDISQLPLPLPRAPMATMKGTRSLELTPLSGR